LNWALIPLEYRSILCENEADRRAFFKEEVSRVEQPKLKAALNAALRANRAELESVVSHVAP
jgi:hypothetical protein